MARFLPGLLIAIFLAAALPAAGAPSVVIVAQQGDASSQAIGRLLRGKLQGKVDFQWLSYSDNIYGDPIYKGKVLASLAEARLVVPIGNDAAALVLRELEDERLYFVGVSLLSGSDMAAVQTAGLLSYSPQDILAAIPVKWKDGLGLFYSPGYEPIIERIQIAAKTAGVKIISRRIAGARDLPRAAQRLMGSARMIWLLGDPLLVRGAGFEFLLEQSLVKGVPLIAAGSWEVGRGAAFCSQAKPEDLAEKAAQKILSLLADGDGPIEPRIETAPSGGRIVFYPGVMKRFRLSPKPPVWTEVERP